MLEELHLSKTEAEDLLVLYRCVFPIARILHYDEIGGKKCLRGVKEPCRCFDFWKRSQPCAHCISSDVLTTKKDGAKIEFVDGKVFQVIAKYAVVDNKPCVIELVKELQANTYVDPEAYNYLLDTNLNVGNTLYRDPLTSSLNRLFYEDHKNDVLNNTGVAFMDIDNFKQCNDFFGHKYGDEVLNAVVKTIQELIRNDDALIRFGGDEFILVINNISEISFKNKLEQIRANIKKHSLNRENKNSFSVSIGAVIANNETLEAAVEKADSLMYKAKQYENRVVTDWDDEYTPIEISENKPLILVADDALLNRFTLKELLKDDFDVLEAGDGKSALTIIEEYSSKLNAILLDINMPEMNGYELLDILNRRGYLNDIPCLMISTEQGFETIMKCYDLGASDFISRPFVASIVKKRVSNIVKLYERQRKFKNEIMEQADENAKVSMMMTSVLSHIVEYRNNESGPHVIHVENITNMLVDEIERISDKYCFTLEDKKNIATASALHDIGKIGVDERILNKPGKLTNQEFEEMKKHTLIGAEMIDRLDVYKNEPLVHYIHDICRWHHERWDGRGYPDKLKGDEIPICAQIVALADVYDALTSKRVYKDAYSHEDAIKMILNNECGSFNPILLDALKSCSYRLKNLREYVKRRRGGLYLNN